MDEMLGRLYFDVDGSFFSCFLAAGTVRPVYRSMPAECQILFVIDNQRVVVLMVLNAFAFEKIVFGFDF
jgi:hypothetical protein